MDQKGGAVVIGFTSQQLGEQFGPSLWCLLALPMSARDSSYIPKTYSRGHRLFFVGGPESFWTDSSGAGHSNKLK